MFKKSIYKKLIEDFTFLKEYGYDFMNKLEHYVMPSVIFQKGKVQIQIGFSYEEHNFFINIVDMILDKCYSYDKSKHLFIDIDLVGTSYEQQLNQAKKVLRDYLVKKEK